MVVGIEILLSVKPHKTSLLVTKKHGVFTFFLRAFFVSTDTPLTPNYFLFHFPNNKKSPISRRFRGRSGETRTRGLLNPI